MSSPKTPADSKTNDGSNWYTKKPSELTPEEEQAMRAEADWAAYATMHDVPGPKRFGVDITRRRPKSS